MSKSVYEAAVHQDNDLFLALCSELGTVSQGKSLEEALANLAEATELATGNSCEFSHKMVDEEEFDRLESVLMETEDDEFWDDDDLIFDEDTDLFPEEDEKF